MKFPQLRFLRRIPFTLVMLLLVALAGVGTASHWEPLQPTWLERFGFAPRHLSRGELLRLATSVFLTPGGITYYLSLAMLGVCVGLAERRVGTGKAVLTFWGVHLATLLVQSLVLALPYPRLDVWWLRFLAVEHDVGPSAGYYGCLGLICHKQPAERRTWLVVLIGGVLLARVVLTALNPAAARVSLSADVAHLIAFPLGTLLARRL